MKHNSVFHLLSSRFPAVVVMKAGTQQNYGVINPKSKIQNLKSKMEAFTLIELLVVMTIILTLTALLLPAIGAARNCAKTGLCAANMHHLVSELLAYDTMNDALPYGFNSNSEAPAGGYAGNLAYDKLGWWWFNYLLDVYGGNSTKRSIVQCPAKHLTSNTFQLDILCGNYGVNLSLCKTGSPSETEFTGKPLSRNAVRQPGRTLLVVDSGYGIIKWWQATESPPGNINKTVPIDNTAYIPGLSINSTRTLLPGQKSDAIDGRHPGKTVNVGFVDGSVSLTKAEDLLVQQNGKTYDSTTILWQPR